MELLTKASYSDNENERELRNRAAAYRAACGSVVLLKNEGALPFRGNRVAVYGAGAAHTVKGGTGSGEVNERRSVSILEGLRARGFEIATERWLLDYETEYEKKLAEYKKGGLKIDLLHPASVLNLISAKFRPPSGRPVGKKDIADSATENCIYIVSRQAGEGGDRKLEKGDYYLTDAELADIRLCAEQYKRFVLIVNCGSPVELSECADMKGLRGILFIGQLGSEGGLAVADMLSGAVTPSGKLADTWARSYDDLPYAREYSSLNGELEQEYYKEGIFVGYRFFDSFGREPLYPFGFGLSYTDFRFGAAKVSAEGTTVRVALTVTNKGLKYSGRETVQVYVSAPGGSISREYQSLAAYKKTSLLAPGRSETVELSFDMSALAAYRFDDASYVLEKGSYIVRVGNSSRNTVPAAIVRLDEEVTVSRHAHICPVVAPFLELRGPGRPAESPEKLPVVNIRAADFSAKEYVYETPEMMSDGRIRRFVESLSAADMAEIVVGVGPNGTGRFQLPGAVGGTTSKFWDRGLANTALCDGPAGLRVSRRAAVDASGSVKPLEMVISFYEKFPEFVKKKMLGDETRDTVMYQFATAFPVESALAQSWDDELMYEIGRAIHDEMREYGCTWWLAPAVNIHRNPLCGRNFEYFSEDPLLAGSLAAALIRGVQCEEGYYVTVKHFACNEQEDNRNKVSSNVGERALREIYLRPFEIAVRRGGAKSVMTSYNRLNGVYTANSYDLCTRVLRNEWGFDGVVMTDWFSTLVTKNGAALAIKAGNDLIMPGEPLSKKNIVRAVEKGLLTQAELRRCCCNVVKAIMNSAIQKEYIG